MGSLPFRYIAVALLSFATLQLVHAQNSALGGGGEVLCSNLFYFPVPPTVTSH